LISLKIAGLPQSQVLTQAHGFRFRKLSIDSPEFNRVPYLQMPSSESLFHSGIDVFQVLRESSLESVRLIVQATGH